MITPDHPNGELDPDVKKRAYISLGICPYCQRNMDKRTNGKESWWYCYGCFNNFNVTEDSNEKGN